MNGYFIVMKRMIITWALKKRKLTLVNGPKNHNDTCRLPFTPPPIPPIPHPPSRRWSAVHEKVFRSARRAFHYGPAYEHKDVAKKVLYQRGTWREVEGEWYAVHALFNKSEVEVRQFCEVLDETFDLAYEWSLKRHAPSE